MIKIAISNRKGGVAKTTSSVNLAEALARMGFTVLLVDLDPQTHSSKWLGAYGDGRLTVCDSLYHHLKGASIAPLAEVLTRIEDFYLAPGSENMAALETELQRDATGRDALSEVLSEVEENFDICLIDCPPSLGILNTNALVAADYLVIPLRMGILDFDGVAMLLQEVKKVQRKANPNLQVLGIFGTFVEANNRVNAKVKAMLTSFPDARPYVLDSYIAKNTVHGDCPDAGTSIFGIGRRREVREAADDYVNLAAELLGRIGVYSSEQISDMSEQARIKPLKVEASHAA